MVSFLKAYELELIILEKSISAGRLFQTKLLLKNGNIDFTHPSADQLLRAACQISDDLARTRWNMVALLIEKGCDVNAEVHAGKSVFSWFCSRNDLKQVKYLVKAKPMDIDYKQQDENGDSALTHAVRTGNLELVSLVLNKFLQFGISVDEQNNDDVTSYVTAVRLGLHDVANLLVEKGHASRSIRVSPFVQVSGRKSEAERNSSKDQKIRQQKLRGMLPTDRPQRKGRQKKRNRRNLMTVIDHPVTARTPEITNEAPLETSFDTTLDITIEEITEQTEKPEEKLEEKLEENSALITILEDEQPITLALTKANLEKLDQAPTSNGQGTGQTLCDGNRSRANSRLSRSQKSVVFEDDSPAQKQKRKSNSPAPDRLAVKTPDADGDKLSVKDLPVSSRAPLTPGNRRGSRKGSTQIVMPGQTTSRLTSRLCPPNPAEERLKQHEIERDRCLAELERLAVYTMQPKRDFQLKLGEALPDALRNLLPTKPHRQEHLAILPSPVRRQRQDQLRIMFAVKSHQLTAPVLKSSTPLAPPEIIELPFSRRQSSPYPPGSRNGSGSKQESTHLTIAGDGGGGGGGGEQRARSGSKSGLRRRATNI